MDTITTTLHAYYFDISDLNEREQYEALVARLEAQGMKCTEFLALPSSSSYCRYVEHLDGKEVQLETRHLFDNQWNTACGLRVFDWVQGIYPNKNIKSGHYLVQTDEMRELRRNTHGCGYCGHQERAERGSVFCTACLGSGYLKSGDLHLLRMVSVEQDRPERPELTEAERAHLMPLYIEAQRARALADAEVIRAELHKNFKKAVHIATVKRDASLWVFDNVPNLLPNMIYYSHIETFCFGWRTPLTDAEVSQLLDVISEFPFPYEIKAEDGVERSSV